MKKICLLYSSQQMIITTFVISLNDKNEKEKSAKEIY